MDFPKISVITVVYNDKEGLEKTIQSVLSQTYGNVEYIVVDGRSTDGTVDVIKKYEQEIDIWVSEPDEGIYDAMNKGIKMASGEWLNFMNAGDVFYDENVLFKAFSIDIKNKEFMYSDYWQSDKTDGKYYWHEADRKKGFVHHQSSIYKKDLHQTYGYYLTQKPISVYDLIFFLSVPEDKFFKLPFEIAKNDGTGISNRGKWVWEKAEITRVLFGIKTLNSAIVTLMKVRLRDSLPWGLVMWIEKYILRKKKICDVKA